MVDVTSTSSFSSIEGMLTHQTEIIQALLYVPSMLDKYIHYRGATPVQFRGNTVLIPDPPFIPYNNPEICCILESVMGAKSSDGFCKTLTIEPLGPRGKVGIPYIAREVDGTNIIVKVSRIDKPYSQYRSQPPTSITNADHAATRNCISNIPLASIRYIASDEFTNETLISYILNMVAAEHTLPRLYVQHYQGAICSDKQSGKDLGLNLMENCDMGTLDTLPEHIKFLKYSKEYTVRDQGRDILGFLVDPVIITQILTQIVAGLQMLQKYAGFVSGDLKSGNIFVKSEAIDTVYEGVVLRAPFTCKIGDYGKSSCMVPKPGTPSQMIRFYNESTLANIYLSLHPFVPATRSNRVRSTAESLIPEIAEENNEYYYSIGNLRVSQIYTRTRHMGLPFYRSFDYYTILVSMLTHSAFYYMFFATDSLRQTFWDPVWMSTEDAEEALKRIRQHVMEGTGQRISDAITMLRGLKLKCNVIGVIMDSLKGQRH